MNERFEQLNLIVRSVLRCTGRVALNFMEMSQQKLESYYYKLKRSTAKCSDIVQTVSVLGTSKFLIALHHARTQVEIFAYYTEKQ